MGLPFDSPLGYIFYLALPVAAIAALVERRRLEPVSYIRGFGLSLGVTAIGAVIYAAYVFGYNALIDDSLVQSVRSASLADLANRDLSAEADAARRQMIDMTSTPLGFAITIAIQMIVVGILVSLVVPVFSRRRAALQE